MSITRSHLAAAQSDPDRNRFFRRRWSPEIWEARELESHATRAERQGDLALARDLAMRALRLRVVEASR